MDDVALLYDSHGLQYMRSEMEDLRVAGEKVGLRVSGDKTKLTKLMTI